MMPSVFTSGDTLSFTETVNDYAPEDGWVLSYVLVNSLYSNTVTGSDNGDGTHLITETAANTGSWIAGDYRWQSYVAKGVERFTVSRGSITIKPNFADGRTDGRNHVEKTLAALESLIEGKAVSDAQQYSINNRSITKLTPTELLEWRDRYKRELEKLKKEDELQAGIGSSNKVYTRLKV